MTGAGQRQADPDGTEAAPSAPGFETLAIHAGQDPDPLTGAVVPPIYQTSTFKQDGVGGLRGGYEYSRTANPTNSALEECLAALEGSTQAGTQALAFASGMAAEDCLIRAVCSPGDRVVIPDDAYGGTYRLFAAVLARWGLDYVPVHLSDLAAVRRCLADQPARVVWVETPTNPLLGIADIAALAEVAHEAGALLVVDNTFASPRLQRPLVLGADVVVHSTTKYLGGHSDVVGGALVTADAGVAECAAFLRNATGAVPGPFESWLTLRGVRTLAVRMDRHCDSAAQVRRDAWPPPGGGAGAVPGPAVPSGTCGRGQADERVRRDGLLPGAGRRGGRRGGLRAHPAVHAGRVARGSGVTDRAPEPDDACIGGGVAAGGVG